MLLIRGCRRECWESRSDSGSVFLFLLQHQTPKVTASLNSAHPRMTGTFSLRGPRPGTQTCRGLCLLEAQLRQLALMEHVYL